MATKEQIKMIRTLARRANRRIERATPGQRNALISYAGGQKFSAGSKGLSEREAAQKIEKMKRFLESPSTTRTGWERMKEENLRKAREALGRQDYTITDEELAEIIQQLGDVDDATFYRAINLVEVERQKGYWAGGSGQIAAAIVSKASAQEALKASMQVRGKK